MHHRNCEITPSNLAISCMSRPKVEVLAEINLPMLVKLAKVREEHSLPEAIAMAQEAGRKYVTIASRILAGKSEIEASHAKLVVISGGYSCAPKDPSVQTVAPRPAPSSGTSPHIGHRGAGSRDAITREPRNWVGSAQQDPAPVAHCQRRDRRARYGFVANGRLIARAVG